MRMQAKATAIKVTWMPFVAVLPFVACQMVFAPVTFAQEPAPNAASIENATSDQSAPSLEQVLANIESKIKPEAGAKPQPAAGQEGSASQSGLLRNQVDPRSPDHSLESLIIDAVDFARSEHAEAERVDVVPTPIDRRLRLKRCDEQPEYTWTSPAKTMGNTTITARCGGTAPWKILIRAQVRVFYEVPVLSAPVNKGDILLEDLVTLRLLDVSALRKETMRSVHNVIGYRFKRRLAAGREISSSILAAPKVVSKGDSVLINASNQVIDVQMKGTALSGGEVGRKIRVRSNSSGRVVQTWIKGPGQVVVMP